MMMSFAEDISSCPSPIMRKPMRNCSLSSAEEAVCSKPRNVDVPVDHTTECLVTSSHRFPGTPTATYSSNKNFQEVAAANHSVHANPEHQAADVPSLGKC
jgi:hypothetical protein